MSSPKGKIIDTPLLRAMSVFINCSMSVPLQSSILSNSKLTATRKIVFLLQQGMWELHKHHHHYQCQSHHKSHICTQIQMLYILIKSSLVYLMFERKNCTLVYNYFLMFERKKLWQTIYFGNFFHEDWSHGYQRVRWR